ncbi:phenylacetate--CoA ligase family protein [Thauera sp. 2A1]|uniref:phenylacetate--CoA ligase family protein n=1 Tax=Thauera sp. 2A1 TaxID=2570191 RepID=UPI0012923B7A|nr:phenylacetate--CoA ligase family protein [Thauera sp. 2A1]KAI5916659.1 phenylacetate--CoA ligase family protein [Thauera sp. 2A1]
MLTSLARAIYRAQEAALGRPTFDYWQELEQSQWLSRDAIEALQARKLNVLLRHALAHSPWHAERIRAAGLEDAVRASHVGIADLARLPTMGKRDARENLDHLVWRDAPGGVFKYNTGGSSGEPLIFYFGRSRQASDAAGRMRARNWWGVAPGDREAYLWGAPVELNKTDRVKTLRDRLVNQLVLNAFAMSPERMDAYLDTLKAWQPKCLYGYASSVALLAAHAEARGVDPGLKQLKVVCTTGEPLYPHQRELIGRVFGAPVANEFGSRDIGFTAHEAPGGQMLLLSESHIVEVLDAAGAPVAPGEVGEAVVTGLTSEAQPFIRYRTGDTLRLSTQPAAGGRGLHVIAEVSGRQTDFVVARDGRVMHALAVIYVLRAAPGVAQFKCIQHAIDRMEVQVVPGPGWSDASRSTIEAGLQARLGASLRIDLRLMDEIPPEASGKHRYVVSHVPLAGGLQQAAA